MQAVPDTNIAPRSLTPRQLIVTLDDDAVTAQVRKTLSMIKGVVSVKAKPFDRRIVVTPTLQAQIDQARKDASEGKLVSLNSIDEINQYFSML